MYWGVVFKSFSLFEAEVTQTFTCPDLAPLYYPGMMLVRGNGYSQEARVILRPQASDAVGHWTGPYCSWASASSPVR